MKNKSATIQEAMSEAPVIEPIARLNVDVMKKLYEFGGLIAYQVKYFDVISFSVKQYGDMTFCEEKARKICEGFARSGVKAEIFRHMVQFDGAFAEKQTGENT